MIFSGSLNKKITIQALTITRGTMGEAKESYSTVYANVPAQIKLLSGREKFHSASDREISYNDHRFIIRYIDGITEKHRILWNGKAWDIVSIGEIGLRVGLEIIGQLAK